MGAALQATAAVAQGIGNYQQAQATQEQANLNAQIARTRALQTDAASRQGMEQQLDQMRSAIASNGQQLDSGTLPLLDAMRTARNQDRVIRVNDEMNQAAGYDMKAKNAGIAGTTALIGGALKAGPSLFDIYKTGNLSGAP